MVLDLDLRFLMMEPKMVVFLLDGLDLMENLIIHLHLLLVIEFHDLKNLLHMLTMTI